MTRRDTFWLIAFFALLITLMILPAWIDHNQPAPIPDTYQLPTISTGEQP